MNKTWSYYGDVKNKSRKRIGVLYEVTNARDKIIGYEISPSVPEGDCLTLSELKCYVKAIEDVLIESKKPGFVSALQDTNDFETEFTKKWLKMAGIDEADFK